MSDTKSDENIKETASAAKKRTHNYVVPPDIKLLSCDQVMVTLVEEGLQLMFFQNEPSINPTQDRELPDAICISRIQITLKHSQRLVDVLRNVLNAANNK